MQVSDLMQTEVQTIPADDALSEALVAMAEARISSFPVVDAAGHLVGVISRTDILASEEEAESGEAREVLFERSVRELMSSPAITISPDSTVQQAARQMLEAGVHRLIVKDGEAIVGIISVTDIVSAVAAGRL